MDNAGEWRGLYINPAGLRVLVVGGGNVGTRRAIWFSSAGAKVTVIAKEISEELKDAASQGRISVVNVDLGTETGRRLLEDAVGMSDFVVIALNGSLAREAAEIALRMGKLVNNAVDASHGNVIVPFQAATSYGLRVAVTSLGDTGVAARIILESLLKYLESPWARALYISMKCYKKILKIKIKNINDRMELYFLPERDEEYWKHVREGDWRGALRRALTLAGLDDGDYPFCNALDTGREK